MPDGRQFLPARVSLIYAGGLVGLTGCTGAGPGGAGLMAGSGSVGVTTAPASFAVWKVVPGGVCGGRRSMMRLV